MKDDAQSTASSGGLTCEKKARDSGATRESGRHYIICNKERSASSNLGLSTRKEHETVEDHDNMEDLVNEPAVTRKGVLSPPSATPLVGVKTRLRMENSSWWSTRGSGRHCRRSLLHLERECTLNLQRRPSWARLTPYGCSNAPRLFLSTAVWRCCMHQASGARSSIE